MGAKTGVRVRAAHTTKMCAMCVRVRMKIRIHKLPEIMVLINIGKVIARIARWMFVIWCEKYWSHIFFKCGLISEGILILAP